MDDPTLNPELQPVDDPTLNPKLQPVDDPSLNPELQPENQHSFFIGTAHKLSDDFGYVDSLVEVSSFNNA